MSKKDYIWNPATCNFENSKYLASAIDDSPIIWMWSLGQMMKELILMKNFLLIIITLLITVIIYCYLIKYQGKQKHLLLFHET